MGAKEIAIALENWLSNQPANTGRAYRQAWKTWCCFLREASPGDASETEVVDFLQQQKRNGYAGRTLDQRFAALVSIYAELVKRGLSTSNPFLLAKGRVRWSKEDVRPPRALRNLEVNKMLESAIDNERDEAMLAVLFYAGVRRSDARNLRLSDIAYAEDGSIVLRLRRTKSQRSHTVAMSSEGSVKLEKWLAVRRETARREDFVFVKYFKNGNVKQLSDPAFYRLFMRYSRACGVGVTPHGCRHTLTTKLLKEGVSVPEAQGIMGHASAATTLRYAEALKRETGASVAVSYLNSAALKIRAVR